MRSKFNRHTWRNNCAQAEVERLHNLQLVPTLVLMIQDMDYYLYTPAAGHLDYVILLCCHILIGHTHT